VKEKKKTLFSFHLNFWCMMITVCLCCRRHTQILCKTTLLIQLLSKC